jgi:hypothetical protein
MERLRIPTVHRPPMTKPLLEYLYQCHRQDNRGGSIWNLLQNREDLCVVPQGSTFLQDGLDLLYLDDLEWAKETKSKAGLYKREKQLVFGAHFVAGTQVFPNQPNRKKYCAPLLYAPAELVLGELAGKEMAQLQIETGQLCWNLPLLELLLSEDDGGAVDDLPLPPYSKPDAVMLSRRLERCIPGLNWRGLAAPKELSSVKSLAAAADRKGLKLVTGSLAALVSVPKSSQGGLFELEEMGRCDLSSAVRAVLGEEVEPREAGSGQALPVLLSKGQSQILSSIDANPLSVVIGPPGTGKSFTLAAMAVHAMARGESVLIVGRTEAALDAVEERLEDILGGFPCIVRGGDASKRRVLLGFIDDLLRGVLPFEELGKHSLPRLESEYKEVELLCAAKEKEYEAQTALHLKWSALQASGAARLSRWWTDTRIGRPAWARWSGVDGMANWSDGIIPSSELWSPLREYTLLLERRMDLQSQLLKLRFRARAEKLRRQDFTVLKDFQQALKARASATRDQRFAKIDLRKLFGLFSIWMADFPNLHRFVPFQKEIFDVALVDEATHCDMAISLPALQRAKRCAITGDPKQLRHSCWLSRAEERRIALAAGFPLDRGLSELPSYRASSLLDLAEGRLRSAEQIATLDEHFRSTPQLIAFSNEAFYGGRLRVMTAYPGRNMEQSLYLHKAGGTRNAAKVNQAEIELLARILAERMEAEPGWSFGVLSPFQAQTQALIQHLQESFSHEVLERHDVLVSTPYGFQGQERDCMLISLGADPGSHSATFRYLGGEAMFNVAVTRARKEQHIFSSLEPKDLPAGHLLGRYLSGIAEREGLSPSTQRSDAFFEEVCDRLRENHTLWPSFQVARMEVDLVAERDGTAIAIDFIGGEGAYGDPISLEELQVLRRVGMALFCISYYSWTKDSDAVLAQLDSCFQRERLRLAVAL